MPESNNQPTDESVATELRPPLSPPAPSGAQRVFWGPNGLRAGWRLLIYIALVWALTYGVFSAFRILVRTVALPPAVFDPSEPAGLTVNRGLLILALLLAAWIMSRVEKRPLGAYGLPARHAFRGQFWEGALWGFASL